MQKFIYVVHVWTTKVGKSGRHYGGREYASYWLDPCKAIEMIQTVQKSGDLYKWTMRSEMLMD